jgi:DNA polymerase elongation subunit (family B)
MEDKLLTNIRYDKTNDILFGKFYLDKELHELPWKHTFFAKAGKFKSSSILKVSPATKCHYLTNELVDKVTSSIKDPFSSSPKETKDCLYQYDISPEYQYLLYNNIEFSEKLIVAYLDIETADDLNAEEAKSPILLINVIWNDNETYHGKVFSKNDYKTEKLMLEDFFHFINDVLWPDIILGWNVVNYDRQYLKSRAERLKVKINWNKFLLISWQEGIDIVLALFGYAIIKEATSLSLDNVAKHFLKEGKMKFEGSMKDFYNKHTKLAIEYNYKDNKLVKKLDQKLKLTDFIRNMQKISGVLLRDSLHYSKIIDLIVLRKYPDLVFPSKWESKDLIEDYEGGYVIQPPIGVFENVVGFDFASLYPSIVLTFNVSPDSKDINGDINIDGIKFNSKKPGLMKQVLEFIYTERFRLKSLLKDYDKESFEYITTNLLQTAYKNIMNSFYGVMAYEHFRFFDVEVAKSITFPGRMLLNYIPDKVKNTKMGEVIYGDTDSFFVICKDDPEKILKLINEKFVPEFVNSYSPNIEKNYIRMEINNKFKKMAVFGKKKVYICQFDNGELYYKGHSITKYDTPKCIRIMFDEIIKDLFNGKDVDLSKYMDTIRKTPMHDLVMPKKFNKAKTDYKVDPQHLRALEFSQKCFIDEKLSEETVNRANLVRMIFIKADKEKWTDAYDALIIDDNITKLPNGIEIDYDKYATFFFHQKLEDVLSVFKQKDIYAPPPKVKRVKKEKKDELITAEVRSFIREVSNK